VLIEKCTVMVPVRSYAKEVDVEVIECQKKQQKY